MHICYVVNTIIMGLLGQIQYMESVNVIEVATIKKPFLSSLLYIVYLRSTHSTFLNFSSSENQKIGH
jgi:hypothetical protein